MNPQDIQQAHAHAEKDWLGYWEEAAEDLEWFKRWDTVLDDTNHPYYLWFPGARCNIVHNALDRHVETAAKNRLAVIWEGEPGDIRKFSYYELYREVNRFANLLRSKGVQKGDRVLIYMPPLPETIIAMLAAAKVGAVHTVVFGGFSSRALAERIRDCEPAMVVTVDGFYRNGRVIPLKPLADKALRYSEYEVCHMVVVHRAHVDIKMHEGRDIWWHTAVPEYPCEADTEIMEAGDPLFLLHTSGTTGKPKAVMHGHGGYMVGVNRTMRWVLDSKPTDIFWCTADPAWITGHSYLVYGPLMAGSTIVLYEGHPLYPEPSRLWSMVERWGVTVLYTVPTLIRMLMRFGANYPAKHDLTTLRLLASTGEPIAPETWVWFHKHIGRGKCPVLDTWWQSEAGMCMAAPLPVSLLKPGSVTRPLPAIEMDVVDSKGNSLPPCKGGFLVIKRPWPSMLTGIYNDDTTFKELYWNRFPGWFFTGDVARKDEDGYFWVQGRADDVIMIAGHRVGSAELEAALLAHPAVAECAIIGVPDDIKGEVAKAFVVLHNDELPLGGIISEEEIAEDIVTHIRRELGPIAVIKDVAFRETLPKNKNGKIVRRVLRAEDMGCDPGDISTLEKEELFPE